MDDMAGCGYGDGRNVGIRLCKRYRQYSNSRYVGALHCKCSRNARKVVKGNKETENIKGAVKTKVFTALLFLLFCNIIYMSTIFF